MSTGGIATSTRFPLFSLLVLSGAVFVSVSSEFLPTGLLPDMAAELEVSESRIGLLVTIFALTVVLTTVPLTAVTRRFSRKWLMVVLLAVFAVSNVLAAFAPTYELLAAARVVGGAAHGLFWAVTGPYASRLVPRQQMARALSITNAGGVFAFILGVPLGTALGQALGWRWAFGVMGAVVVLFLVLVVLFLPPVEHIVPLATGEIGVPARRDKSIPGVLIVCVSVLLFMLGQNVFYTYIAPWVIQIGGIPASGVSALLFVYGAAGAIGLVLSGVFGDRYPRASVAVSLIGIAASVAALAAFGPGSPVAIVLTLISWSIFFGGLPALFHARNLHSSSLRIRDQAAAWLTISFNIAIGGGALLGGIVLDGFGIGMLPWVEVGLVFAALVFVLSTDRIRMRAHPQAHVRERRSE